VQIGVNSNNVLDSVTGSRNINGTRITGAAEPINSSDLATRGFVESVAQGLDVKEAVKVATVGGLAGTYATSGQTLTANSNGAIQVDGVTLSTSDRLLLRSQADGTQNGIYTVTTTGDGSTAFVLTRALDSNTSSEVGAGAFAFVETGTANAGKSFIQSVSGPTLDTDSLTFSVFGDSTIAADSVDNAKLANMAQASVKGRASGTSTGDPVDLTPDQLVAIINAATSALNAARLPSTADTNARIAVEKNGGSIGTRRTINFIEGSNVSLTIDDDASGEEVDVTINSTASGGGGASLGLAIALG
jgi:hypothetical protein